MAFPTTLTINLGTETQVGSEAVSAGKIKSEAVETAKIKLLAVTAGTLAEEAVTEAKVTALAVTEGKLGAEAVSEAKLKNEAVATGKIKQEAVTQEKIAEAKWEAVEGLTAKLKELAPNALPRVAKTGGIVFLVGVAEVKEEVAAKTIIFKLPVGYRPEKQFTFWMPGKEVLIEVVVKTTGEVEAPLAIKTTNTPLTFNLTIPLK